MDTGKRTLPLDSCCSGDYDRVFFQSFSLSVTTWNAVVRNVSDYVHTVDYSRCRQN